MIRAALFLCLALTAPGFAQDFRAMARVVPDGSEVVDTGGAVELTLGLSQAVPFRVRVADGPARIVLDFREVLWDGLPAGFDGSDIVTDLATGSAGLAEGWSRMVLTLDRPMAVETAVMETDDADGSARVRLILAPVPAEDFAEMAVRDAVPLAAQVDAAPAPLSDRLVIMLDPGHGGVDPGAQADGHDEADLMLLFARELRDLLVRTGLAEVHLTRDGDEFVPLITRVTLARQVGADAFLSLHADALAQGRATGATVYTLSEDASDAASAALAERHDRTDLLHGVDLSASDDAVAGVLMELARVDTDPRSGALADAIVAAIGEADGDLHRHPRLEAGFTVLTAADIPSVLVEVGFLSNPRDLQNLLDPEWRRLMQEAMVAAILGWADEDAAHAPLRRQ